MNRRSFISSLAVAGTAVAATPSRLLAAGPNARPRVGLIGCGWYGGGHLESMAKTGQVEIASLCDPNQKALAETLKLTAKLQSAVPKTFVNFREMLASTHHDIVIVGTPDHWHTLPAIAAMQAGADVYLEKPISVDVMEGEALVAAARKYDRVVQVNTQRRSNPCYAEARDKYLRSGRLGNIGLVEAYSYLPGRPTEVVRRTPPPAHLDYELWTGPAPLRPYQPVIESLGWRAFMEYGNGQIGDLGVHIVDYVRWMLGLSWPQSIQSTGGIYVDRESSANISDTQRSVLHYPNLDVSWEHRTWGTSPIPPRHWTDQWGARFMWKNGTLNVSMLGYDYTPADGGPREGFHMLSATRDLENVDFSDWGTVYDDVQKRHMADFLQARATRSRPVADVEEGHISTACCVLANLSQELGRALAYDPISRTVVNDAEATRRLSRPYRGPWVHPTPSNV